MASETVTTPTRTRTPMGDLARRGLTALVVALVAVALARLVAGALVTIPAGFEPMQWGAILSATVVATVIASVLYALLDRFTAKPRRNFLALAALAFLFMLVPLLTVAPAFPGASTTLVAVLFAFHVIVAVAITVPLTREQAVV